MVDDHGKVLLVDACDFVYHIHRLKKGLFYRANRHHRQNRSV